MCLPSSACACRFSEDAGDFWVRCQTDPGGSAVHSSVNEYQANAFAASQLAVTLDPVADAAALITALAIASNTESPGRVTIPDSAMAVALTHELKNKFRSR